MTVKEQSLVDSSTNLPESQTLVQRLRIRASIRRSIPHRKSVQEGKPDRIDSRGQSLDDDAGLLEEAADMIDDQWDDIKHMQDVIERLHTALETEGGSLTVSLQTKD